MLRRKVISSIWIIPRTFQKTVTIIFPIDFTVFVFFGASSSSEIYCFEIVIRAGFTMSTHLADSFFINCSCKIEITVPCDILVSSTSLCTFTRWSVLVKTISWTLSMISGVAASIGRLERDASHVDVRPCLNSFTQLYTVVNIGADVLWTLTRLWFLSALNLSYVDVWSLHETHFFPFCKIQRFALIVYRNESMRWIPQNLTVISWEMLLVKK